MTEQSKKANMALEGEKLKLEEENITLRKEKLKLLDQLENAENKVRQLEAQISILPKYSFNSFDGISRNKENHQYCTSCLLNLMESPLDNNLRCPKCKTQYEDR